MFQVLIADDEKTVRDSLQESICWKELGLEVAGVAANGYEAMGMIESGQIDIAILDIRMPGLDGLRLCAMLKEKRPQIQILVISGYAEFAYAQKVIGYGVLCYCLKPLDYEEITKYLLRAVRNLRGRREISARDILEAAMDKDEERVRLILESHGILGGRYFVAASVGEHALHVPGKDGLTIWMGVGIWGYICREGGLPTAKQTDGQIQGLGILKGSVSVTGLFDALEQCIAMAYQYFVDPSVKVCMEWEQSEPTDLLNDIWQFMHYRNDEMLQRKLMEIRNGRYREFTIKSSVKLYNILCMATQAEAAEDEYIYSFRQIAMQYGSLSQMLDEICGAMFAKGEEEPSASRPFLNILDYVESNYREDITLDSVSQALHMNASYISRLFKKESGISFVRYITSKRLEAAKWYLEETQMPVSEIAVKVGFHDYYYFLRIFKKFIGVSPGKYRLAEEGQG